LYPSPGGLPLIPGNEGAGVVLSVGPGVTDVKPGDRVAYVNPIGAYAEERIMPADRLVKVPDSISFQQAGSMMLKGMTAYYLLRETFP
ncbi:alcohol dehydrogenase catalytic domain-containing protein, partial [Klebsiella pneumoniae]|nr:alcohol dehydrogenase catalytic domain-containing protein [Klebsiella pneumoniae]